MRFQWVSRVWQVRQEVLRARCEVEQACQVLGQQRAVPACLDIPQTVKEQPKVDQNHRTWLKNSYNDNNDSNYEIL